MVAGLLRKVGGTVSQTMKVRVFDSVGRASGRPYSAAVPLVDPTLQPVFQLRWWPDPTRMVVKQGSKLVSFWATEGFHREAGCSRGPSSLSLNPGARPDLDNEAQRTTHRTTHLCRLSQAD